jgi:hypothetical protein
MDPTAGVDGLGRVSWALGTQADFSGHAGVGDSVIEETFAVFLNRNHLARAICKGDAVPQDPLCQLKSGRKRGTIRQENALSRTKKSVRFLCRRGPLG